MFRISFSPTSMNVEKFLLITHLLSGKYFEKIHIEEHIKELITEKSVCIDGNQIILN